MNYLHYHKIIDGDPALICSWRILPGHKLYRLNVVDNVVSLLDMKKLTTVDYGAGEGYSFLGSENCAYVTALNLKNAIKNFKKMFNNEKVNS